jgi:methyl-accepting chemotaxis protein
MYYGETIEISVNYSQSWFGLLGEGITNARFTAESEEALVQIISNVSTSIPGIYLLTLRVDAPLIPVGISTEHVDITIFLNLENYERKELELSVTIEPTEGQKTMGQAISLVTPGVFIAFLVVVLWTRIFSIPKRLRQLNGMIKTLRKGKIPKPVTDSKTRQELIADLFNDTFEKLEITRDSADMPEASVPIEVPEIRELLIQLSILTHLSPTELDEFNADISKMKMSEQAAFVREVIAQEAIRAARASGKTVDEILEETASESTRLISESEEVTEIIPGLEEPVEERVFLPEDDVVTPEPDTTVETPTVEEKAPTDKLSKFELDELQAELVRKGVPNHEISMIIEQAQDLSRELVDELMRSLGLKE